jgi:hypothetical protein
MNSKSTNKHKSHSTILEDSEAAEMAKMECQIPDFSEMSDSDAENVAMQMSFTARRIAQISTQMVVAKDEDISKLWHERHCFIGKLSKNIKDMESIETNIP